VNSLALKFAVGFLGRATGITGNAGLAAQLGRTGRCSITGSGKQCLDIYQTVIAVSGSLQIDLTTGRVNPLNESISGTDKFATVLAAWVEHDLTSLATAGITAFGGGTNEFQGPKAAADKDTLLPGEWTAFGKSESITGWTVDGTHKRVDVVNLDATLLHTATVNIFIVGTK
jgi:hypothetical protein